MASGTALHVEAWSLKFLESVMAVGLITTKVKSLLLKHGF